MAKTLILQKKYCSPNQAIPPHFILVFFHVLISLKLYLPLILLWKCTKLKALGFVFEFESSHFDPRNAPALHNLGQSNILYIAGESTDIWGCRTETLQERRSQARDGTSWKYEGRKFWASWCRNMVFDWMSACFEKLLAPARAPLSFALLSPLGYVYFTLRPKLLPYKIAGTGALTPSKGQQWPQLKEAKLSSL